ncbi:MAG: phosphatase PAP2 family protein [Ilumatobacteraceae bacterium]
MWLPWQTAFQVAVVLAVVLMALVATRPSQRWLRVARLTVGELVLMFTLYGIWQWVHERAVTETAGAIDRAHSLYRFEQAIGLPSELALQHAFLHNGVVMRFLDVYYGGMHVPAMGLLLVWLFWQHRDRYGRIRWTLALSIAGCLAIQTIPVAPPRFLPELGFVDAGLMYHLSVYGPGGSGISNELAAMPSLHVGWAVLVGVVAVTVGTSRWRWAVLAHPVLTVVAVVATANHWWLDGVVASMVLAAAYLVVRVVEAGARAVRVRWRAARPADVPPPVEPAAVPELEPS